MEEKESLLKTIEDVNDDETVMQEWILEENARLKYEGKMSYAREEGLKEGIEQGIEKGIEQGIQEEKLEMIKNMLNEGTKMYAYTAVTGTVTNVAKRSTMRL